MAAESVQLGMDLASYLLRSSFKRYQCCFLNASLPPLQINYNYSLYCYAQGHNGMVNIRFAFPSWIPPLTSSVGQHSLLHRKFQDPDM